MADQKSTESDPSPTPTEPVTEKRKSWPRRHIWWWLPLVLVLLLVIFLPTLLSTTLGRRVIVGQVNNSLAGRVEIGSLSLSWLNGQAAEDVKLLAPDGSRVLEVKRVMADDVSLAGVLFGQRDFGMIQLQDVDLAVVLDEQGRTNLAAALASPSSKADEPGTSDDDDRDAGPPSWASMSAQWQMTGRASYASPTMETTTIDDITWTGQLQGRQLTTDLAGRVKQANYAGAASLAMQVTDLPAVVASPAAATQYATGHVHLENFATAWIDQLAKANGKLLAVLGPMVSLDLQARKAGGATDDLTVPVVITMRSDTATLDGELVMGPAGVQLIKPVEAAWQVESATWQRVAQAFNLPDKGQLTEQATLTLSITELGVTTTQVEGATTIDWPNIQLATNLEITPVKLTLSDGIGAVALSEARMNVAVSPSRGVIATAAGVAQRGDESGRFSMEATLADLLSPTGPDVKRATGHVEARLTSLPLVVFDQLLPLDGALVEGLGQKLDASLVLEVTEPMGDGAPAGQLTADVAAERLKLVGNFNVADGNITIVQPLTVDAQATPALVERLKAMMALEPDAMLTRVSTTAPLEMAVQIERLAIAMPAASSTWADAAKAATFAGRVSLAPAQVRVAPFDASGQVGNYQTGATQVDLAYDGSDAEKPLTLDARASDVPSAMLDNLANQQGRIVAILGDRANATASTVLREERGGDVDVQLRADNATATLLGRISADKIFTLRSDATADLTATPALSEAFLAALNPLLREVVSADQPIRLTLDAESFTMPLEAFDITRLQAAGTLRLGTLHMKRGRIGGAVVQLLRAAGSKISNREEFDAEFTDMTFTLRDGEVRSSDLWFSTGDLVMGTQARVTLTPGRETGAWQAALLIALPGRTIALVPGLEDLFGPTDVIELPVSGSVAGIQPDLAAFTAKLLEYQAQAQLADKLGPAGGSILKGIGGALRTGLQQDATGQWRGTTWPNQPEPAATPVKPGPGKPAPAEDTPADPSQPSESNEPTTAEDDASPPVVRPKPDLNDFEPTIENGLNLLQTILDAQKKKDRDEKKNQADRKNRP